MKFHPRQLAHWRLEIVMAGSLFFCLAADLVIKIKNGTWVNTQISSNPTSTETATLPKIGLVCPPNSEVKTKALRKALSANGFTPIQLDIQIFNEIHKKKLNSYELIFLVSFDNLNVYALDLGIQNAMMEYVNQGGAVVASTSWYKYVYGKAFANLISRTSNDLIKIVWRASPSSPVRYSQATFGGERVPSAVYGEPSEVRIWCYTADKRYYPVVIEHEKGAGRLIYSGLGNYEENPELLLRMINSARDRRPTSTQDRPKASKADHW